jgi:hypothetical protein
MVRETGMGAVTWLQRILKQRGPDGVVSEIRLIRIDGSKRIFPEDAYEVVREAGRIWRPSAKSASGAMSSFSWTLFKGWAWFRWT